MQKIKIEEMKIFKGKIFWWLKIKKFEYLLELVKKLEENKAKKFIPGIDY